jgi:ribulose-5-phosphate 4-epimerase/fuculose-1-phosphate aldolase
MSKCNGIKEIVQLGKKLDEMGIVDHESGSISIRYGKRIVITKAGAQMGKIKNEDMVEVIDYDPIKNLALVIGLAEPNSETPMHWLIYDAMDKINAIIHVHAMSEAIPTTENEKPYGTLELAMEVLKTFRKGNFINIKNNGSIAIGRNLEEAMRLMKNVDLKSVKK